MIPCSTCGNEIQDKADICPFCDSIQEPRPAIKKSKTVRVVVVKIKEDNPTVDEALLRLKSKLLESRNKGAELIKIIHGYGSSGVGGAIKKALHIKVSQLKESGEIKNYITGEQHNEFAGSRNYLLNKYPELKDTWKHDRGNPGITFIEL